MRAIKDFDKVQENGGYKRLPDGGYIVGVKRVRDDTEKEGLRLEIDICRGEYKNWCQKTYDADKRETKYWPREGQLFRSYKDSALAFFKGFITSVTKSNKGFVWNWQEQSLVNKMFGVVIATEEYRGNNGRIYERPYIASVHSVETIEKGDFEIPPKKLLDPSNVNVAVATNDGNKKKNNLIDPFHNDGNTENQETDIFADVDSAPIPNDEPWY